MEPHLSPSRRGDLRALVVALAVLGLFVAGFAVFGATSNDSSDKLDLSSGPDEVIGGGGGAAAIQQATETTSGAHDHDMTGMEHADGDHDMAHADGHQHGATDAQPASNPAPPADPCDTAPTTTTTTTTTAPDAHEHNHDATTSTTTTTVAATCTTTTTAAAANGAASPTTAATHGEHNHDPGTTVPGSPTTVHGEHNHTEPTTGPTVPGETTTTTPGHNHHEVYAQLGDLDPVVQYQISGMTKWAMQYDTTAKATAAGFPQLTQYFPGIAAHYINLSRLFDNLPFDWSKPEVLLFNGTGADAQLVGFNYIVQGGPNHTPPEGFPGDFDQWHEHPVLCMKNGIVVGEVAQGQTCPAGQTTLPFQNMWLLHVWAIPGWESPEGIFSHENSRV